MFLQVLDDGYLTDSLGRKIDFKKYDYNMTSNVGARQLKDFGQCWLEQLVAQADKLKKV
jgi:ATP-dependent Clp protease ATP-binding subunit ClpC